MFKTLVVALDLEPQGDRALDVVKVLARCAPVHVELVTVSSPGMPSAPDEYELRRRAEQLGCEHTTWSVLHEADVAAALVRHTARHDGALLVMATSARHPLAVVGNTGREVLSRSDRPVLLVGPNVDWTDPLALTTIVACMDASDTGQRAAPTIVDWHATFGGPPPQVAEVVPDDDEGNVASERVRHLVGLLAIQHVAAEPRVVHDDHPVRGLETLASGGAAPLYVTTSARYSDGRLHWHSTTQQLIRDAQGPVLVVPARPRLSAASVRGGGSDSPAEA